MKRFAILATAVVFGLTACQKSQDQSQATNDTTARNLTLAPAESTQQLRDVPANPPANPPPAASTRNPTNRTSRTTPHAPPPPAPPAKPATMTLGSGSKVDIAASDTISSRTAKVGDGFTAHVVEDVRNAAGQVVIPAGSIVNGSITAVKPAPNPHTPGTLTLSVASITVRGTSYPLDAAVDSIETTHKGRGVTTGDAAKVGGGAVAGAILGRVIGGNRKGTIIGGIVGGIAGAGVATQTKASDIVLPAGAHIIIKLNKDLAVAAS